MRAIMLSCLPLAITLAGCSEKIEAQEGDVHGGAVSEQPDNAIVPDEGETGGDDLKMQSPVGID